MPCAHQMRPHLGQLPFLVRGKALKQQFAGHEAQYGIAQKLELFVIFSGIAIFYSACSSFGFHFMGQGAMRKGLAEQFRSCKVVVQRRFKLLDVFDFHRRTQTQPSYFGGAFVAGGTGAVPVEGGAPPSLNLVRRSTSCFANIATGEFAGEISTALLAETKAAGYCFRWSCASAKRR